MTDLWSHRSFTSREAQEPKKRGLSLPALGQPLPLGFYALHGPVWLGDSSDTSWPLPFVPALGTNHRLTTHALFIICKTASAGSLSTEQTFDIHPQTFAGKMLILIHWVHVLLCYLACPCSTRVMPTCREILHFSRMVLHFVSQIRLHMGFPKLL